MEEYVLLFYTAHINGNIAILRGKIVVDVVTVGDGDGKTESIINKVSTLLARNCIDRKKIEKIFYTDFNTEVGMSITKSRILGSILLGLKNSLNLQIETISVTEMVSILKTNKCSKFDIKQ